MKHKKGHSVIWHERGKYVSANGIGQIDEESANWFLECMNEMEALHGSDLEWLLDLSQMKNISSGARKILVEGSRHPSVEKLALFGASTFIRTVANFITAAAGQSNQRHFPTKEAALKWLKE